MLLFLVTLFSKLYILWQIVVSREETDPNIGLGSGQLSVFGASQQLQENVPGICLKNVHSSVGEEFRKILNFPGFGGFFGFVSIFPAVPIIKHKMPACSTP